MPPKRQMAPHLPSGTRFTDKIAHCDWRIAGVLGKGGFGIADKLGTRAKVNAQTDYAIKVELKNSPLFQECSMYQRALKKDDLDAFKKSTKLSHLCLPSNISSGVFVHGTVDLRYLVMPRYGCDVHQVIEHGGALPAKHACQLATSCLHAVEYMHSKGVLIGDVKAENLMFTNASRKKSDKAAAWKDILAEKIVLIDFGLAKLVSGELKPYKELKKRAGDGTMPYNSIDCHRGAECAWRSDIEIIVWCLVEWLNGRLPWHTSKSNDVVLGIKEKIVRNGFGAEVPAELRSSIHALLTYVRGVDYQSRVDYGRVHKHIDTIMKAAAKTKSTPVKSPAATSSKRAVAQTSSDEEEEESPVRVARGGRRPLFDASSSDEEAEETRKPKRQTRTAAKPAAKKAAPKPAAKTSGGRAGTSRKRPTPELDSGDDSTSDTEEVSEQSPPKRTRRSAGRYTAGKEKKKKGGKRWSIDTVEEDKEKFMNISIELPPLPATPLGRLKNRLFGRTPTPTSPIAVVHTPKSPMRTSVIMDDSQTSPLRSQPTPPPAPPVRDDVTADEEGEEEVAYDSDIVPDTPPRTVATPKTKVRKTTQSPMTSAQRNRLAVMKAKALAPISPVSSTPCHLRRAPLRASNVEQVDEQMQTSPALWNGAKRWVNRMFKQ